MKYYPGEIFGSQYGCYGTTAAQRRDGGPGSGNFGHKGIKGQIGGSAPGGGGSGSASGERTSSGGNPFSGGKKTAKASSFKGMSKEQRNKFLDDAPDGAKITGIITKSGPYKGSETVVEKVNSYKKVYGGVGAGSSIRETTWKVGGNADPYFKRNFREILEGKNKYYEMKE